MHSHTCYCIKRNYTSRFVFYSGPCVNNDRTQNAPAKTGSRMTHTDALAQTGLGMTHTDAPTQTGSRMTHTDAPAQTGSGMTHLHRQAQECSSLCRSIEEDPDCCKVPPHPSLVHTHAHTFALSVIDRCIWILREICAWQISIYERVTPNRQVRQDKTKLFTST